MNESRYRQNANAPTSFGSFAKSISKSLTNAMNANKKDDDFGYKNDIQGRRSKTGFLTTIASTNPVFLIIASAFCVILFIVTFILIASSLFGSSSSSKPSTSYTGNSGYNSFNNPAVAMEIDNLLKQFKGTKDDISSIDETNLDKKMSKLMNEYCLNELPFALDFDSKSTFQSHVSFLFTTLLGKDKIYPLSPDTTVVTEYGTLHDTATESVLKVKYAKCSLVFELLKKTQTLHLMQNSADTKLEDNLFDNTNQDTWWMNQHLFEDHDVNAAAFELIKLIKDDGAHIHIAKQLIPMLLNEYCPNVYPFFEKVERQNGSPNTKGKDPKFECVASMQDLLEQLRRHGNIHLSKHEIAAYDKNGHLVAVDKFSLKPDQKFENEWVSCNFIDKIVYYHNVDITQQAKVLIDEIKDNNFYAFENQVDVYMVEHCPETVKILKSRKAAHDQGNMYLSVFRGELTAFAHKVSNGEWIGNTDTFVVANNGGIMHRTNAGGQFTKCKLIQEIGRQRINNIEYGQNNENKQFDENEFNPEYHDSKFAELDKELHHNEKNMDKDVEAIINHAVKDDEQYELKHLITNMLFLYHGGDIINLTPDQFEAIVSEINQYIELLIEVDVNGISKWPDGHVAAIDCEIGKLLLVDEKSEIFNTGNKVISKLFTKVFVLALKSKKQPKQTNEPMTSQSVKNDDNAQYNSYQNTVKNNNNNQYNSHQNYQNDNNNNVNNDEDYKEIRSYVTVLLNDISNQRDIGRLLSDIEGDLRHYCRNMMNGLTSPARRKFIAKLLSIIQGEDENRQRITDPIVNEDGFLKSSNGVPSSERIFKCTFLTELITQRLR